MGNRRVIDLTEQELRTMIREEMEAALLSLLSEPDVTEEDPPQEPRQPALEGSAFSHRLMGAAHGLAQRIEQAPQEDSAGHDSERGGHKKRHSVEAVRQKHSHAYEAWTEEEEQRLVQLVREGYKVKDIAKLLQRQPSAIDSRMTRLKDRGVLY